MAARIEIPKQAQALAHRQKVLQRRFLKQNAGVFSRAPAERFATVARLSGSSAQNALHDLDGRRFARAIWTQEPKAQSLIDRERHTVDRGDSGIALDERADFENGVAHGAPRYRNRQRAILADPWPGRVSAKRRAAVMIASARYARCCNTAIASLVGRRSGAGLGRAREPSCAPSGDSRISYRTS